ncbi:hypothetical protein [Pseudoxanthomonas mexicana]
MKLSHLLPFSAIALAACSQPAAPNAALPNQPASALQCAKDTDCKGDRVCDTGKCVAPAASVAAPVEAVPTSVEQTSSNASAACPQSSVIFSCTTAKKKYVEVCDRGSNISYSFGKPGSKPELSLSIPRSSATTHQWDGMGPMKYTVNIPNGNTVYSVFWSAARDPEAAEPVSAGVDVLINGSSAATVMCNPDTAVQNMEEIDLPAAQA